MQRLQRDDELRRRAVRIGDDVLAAEALGGFGVDLRHDQRHVGVHPPSRGIVDDETASRAYARRPFLRYGPARRHQTDVGRGKVVVIQRLALQRSVAERDFPADRLGGGERDDFRYRKPALRENGEHFTADIAGGADDGDLEARHVSNPCRRGFLASPAWAASSTPGGGTGTRARLKPHRPFGRREFGSAVSELREAWPKPGRVGGARGKSQNHGVAKMSIRDRDSRIARPGHTTFLRRCRRARAIDGARPAWL